MQIFDEDFRRLRYNRRNTAIDERKKFDEFMAKREAAAKTRRTFLFLIALAGIVFVASDPSRFDALGQ